MLNVDERQDLAQRFIAQAILAPSSHNTQPWWFRVVGQHIDLFADRTRALPVNDPDDRELTLSCGCALMNLRIAVASHNDGVKVQLLPDPEDPDWLARLTVIPGGEIALPEAGLVEHIPLRQTYRQPFADRPIEPFVIDALIEAARAEKAWLQPLLAPEARQKTAVLVAEGDVLQWGDPRWRRELAAWMHARWRGDGLTVSSWSGPITQLVVRTLDMGHSMGSQDKDLVESAPLLAVLGSDQEDVRGWLEAGQGLQRVLLTARQLGLQASYLNQPLQVQSLRPEVQKLVEGIGFPQILLRLGYPLEKISPSPRRPLENVLLG
ncbi:MAG: nitroreductase family protein [Thermostichus sp. DG02_5_bins_236]